MAESAPPFLSRHRNTLIVLVVLLVGVLMNVYAPVWFAPPYFDYTIWFYLVLLFAWLPLSLVLLRRTRRPSVVFLAIVIGGGITLCGCTLTHPTSVFGMTILDSVGCVEQAADPGWTEYLCTRHVFEGDRANWTLTIHGPNGSPLLLLKSTTGY
jgi:hypothetical protein